MTTTIALAGKGGVGKTTVAAMVIKYLVKTHRNPVLAIDADPSSNLNMVLGMELDWTVGDIREEMLEQVKESLAMGGAAMGSLPGGVTKRDYLDYQIRTAIIEGNSVDLIAMGRSEGAGCYCAVNHNLRMVIDSISNNYRYVVIDNEAGMEHLSRRTTRHVDHLLIISDPTQRGIVAANRIADFRKELDIQINHAYLIINRLRGEIPPELNTGIERIGIPLLGIIQMDPKLSDFDINGKPLIELEDDNPVYISVAEMMEKLEL
ncbi:MAG: AAA family ATPase [Anaerolineaceae bacterium]